MNTCHCRSNLRAGVRSHRTMPTIPVCPWRHLNAASRIARRSPSPPCFPTTRPTFSPEEGRPVPRCSCGFISPPAPAGRSPSGFAGTCPSATCASAGTRQPPPGKHRPPSRSITGCLSDGVIGAWFALVCGVGPVLDQAKVTSHLRAVHRHRLRHGRRTRGKPISRGSLRHYPAHPHQLWSSLLNNQPP